MIVHEGPVATLGIAFCGMEEKTGDDGLTDQRGIASTGTQFESISLDKLCNLVSDILRPLKPPILDIIILAPTC